MIGSELDGYRLTGELGAGGMGTVYLGERGGERVAVKVVHPHLIATPGFFKRFLREAELGKQVNHENVVRTLDVDATLVDDKQINYMVMEYVEGQSLRDLLTDLGTVPETLLRELALQMAAGVAAIHAEGIVHRDLKPENVLITDDHLIRIMDLGVAKLQEASVALTKEGQFAGSFLYAAPEQFGGGEVGAAADLYSLGVMLYELAVGANPFRHDDTGAVIQAHLQTEPPPARERNQEISEFLSEVSATLLAKKPGDRFASAAELCDVLAEAEESAWWAAREKQLRERAPHLPEVQVRRETEVHGREKELTGLRELFETAAAGRGQVVLLEGEPGIGKTRLVDAFMRTLEREEAHIVYGAYPPSGGMGGMSDAVIGKFGSANLEESLAPYLAETPALVPAFAALAKHEAAPTGSQPLAGDAFHTVTCNLMRALAKEKPTLWVVEDLHYAPAESQQVVLSMARALAKHRVLLLLTARPGLPEDALSHLSRLECFQRMEVGRLSAREVIELLHDAFKSELLAQKLGGTIAYKSDGVPFFVHELIRGLKDGRILSQQPDGTYVQTQQISEIEVPSAVKDLIEGRLRGLSKDERALLEVGAVQGFEFDPDLVARVVERKRVRVLQDLAEVERRTGVVRAAGRKYRFDQYQILELLLGEISEILREDYHSLLAEAFAAREGEDPKDDEGAYFLAWHHLHGSEPDAGLPYLDRALDHLVNAYQADTAETLTRRALKAPGLRAGEKRIDTLLRLARVSTQPALRRDSLEEALQLADATEDASVQLRVRTALSTYLTSVGRFEESLVPAHQALELAADARQELEALQCLAGGLTMLSRHEEAREHAERALELARELGDRSAEAAAMTAQTRLYYDRGPPEAARANGAKIYAIHREGGNRIGQVTSGGNLGLFCHMVGRYADALEHYERALTLAGEMGGRRLQAVTLGNLGRLYAYLGDEPLARKNLEEALTLDREVGNRMSEAYALHRLGEVAEFLGEQDKAERRYREALPIRREISYARGIAETLTCLGRLELARGRQEDARSHLEEALPVAHEVHRPDPIILATAYEALLPGGDKEAAVAAFEEYGERAVHHDKMEARYVLWKATGDEQHLRAAHELLMFGRDNAPDEYKQTILENVPLHRAIVKEFDDRQ